MITSPSIFGAIRDRADNNIFSMVGSGAPTDAVTGLGIGGPGADYTDIVTGNKYINVGTLAAPVWAPEAGNASLRQTIGVISPADIIATGAGKFGHAAGYPMVAAPGLHNIVEFISCIILTKFIVAAYTAGGNITVNATGGAAITGLISAANSLGNAASKAIVEYPLTTAGVLIAENTGLSIVTSAAFTNPGTAAGTLTFICNYRIHPTGF